jgi:hypothetical protein
LGGWSRQHCARQCLMKTLALPVVTQGARRR